MRTPVERLERYSVLVRGAHRWLWLVGIAILAYLVGFLFVVIFFGGPLGSDTIQGFHSVWRTIRFPRSAC